MKYILAISLVSVLALTSCFEKKIPDPIMEDDTMTAEDVLIEDGATPIADDEITDDETLSDDAISENVGINEDAILDDDMMNVVDESDIETPVNTEDPIIEENEIEMYEEDLEALFQDILGE